MIDYYDALTLTAAPVADLPYACRGLNVHQRISAVMAAVSGLVPDGSVAHGQTRYNYITEKQLTTVIREQMIQHGLTAVPIDIKETIRERSGGGYITSQIVVYRISNIDDPADYIDVMSTGQGYDSVDKGAGKASTNAYKYMLFRVFEIPQQDKDDPDSVASDAIAAPKIVTLSRPPAAVLRRQEQQTAGGV